MGSRPNDMYDMYNDEFEDELEDDRPPPPKQTEKRFLNGKHILTNGEITCVLVVSQAGRAGACPLNAGCMLRDTVDLTASQGLLSR